MECPCFSGKKYDKCCQVYHNGRLPPTPEALMRSRYSAYALGLADYIIDTTHYKNLAFESNRDAWKREILNFSEKTEFISLEVKEAQGDQVIFTAFLRQDGQDASFTERSLFKKEEGKWQYLSAEFY